MAVGNTTDFNLTRDELITIAYRKIGQSPGSTAIANTAKLLNLIIREESGMGTDKAKHLWAIAREYMFLIANAQVYNKDHFKAASFENLISATYRNSQGDDTPMEIITTEQYEGIGEKKTTGDPNNIILRKQVPSSDSELHVYPSLSSVTAPSEVMGTDANKYLCIKKHTANANNRPIFGPSYKLFWKQKGNTLVFRQPGTDYPVNIYEHTANILDDGRVLVTGGSTTPEPTPTVQTLSYFGTIVDNTITWVQATALPGTNFGHGMSILLDGRVMMTGGFSFDANGCYLGTIKGNTIDWVQSTDIPETGIFDHSQQTLSDGRVLLVGGIVGTVSDVTYFGTVDGDVTTWVAGTLLPQKLGYGAMEILPDGRIFHAGGQDTGNSAVDATYFGTISGNTITWATGTALPRAQIHFSMNLLDDGRIMIVGGQAGATAYVETYIGTISGNTVTWQTYEETGLLPTEGRYKPTTDLLSDGRVLLIGGQATSSTVEQETFFWRPPEASWVSGTAYIGGEGIQLVYKRPLYDFDSGSDNPDMPQEWFRYLVYRLALDLAPEFNITEETQRRLERNLNQARMLLFPSQKVTSTDHHNKTVFF